ncbi:MAG: glycosyltransferase family 39 protein [bacterium]
MKKNYWFLLILSLAFLLRFLYIYYFTGFYSSPESHGYFLEQVGYNLSQGGGYGSNPDAPTAKKPPLYPAFIALIYLFFGHNFAMARIGHIFLAVLTCIFTFMFSENLLRNISKTDNFSLFPYFSLIILSIIPSYIYVSGWFLTENLCVLFSLLTIYYLLKTEITPSFFNQAASGLFLGLTNLTRPNFISFLFIIPLWAFLKFPKKEAAKIFLIITLTTLTVIAPWMIRNWKIFNGFIPIATGGGRMFLAGNNPQAQGDAILVSGSPRLYYSEGIPQGDEKRDWTKWEGDTWQNMYLSELDPGNFSSGLSEKEADRKYYLQGLIWIKDNPLPFIKLLPRKIYCFWQYWSPHTRWPAIPVKLKLIDLLFYVSFPALVFSGFIFSLRQKRTFLLLYLVLFYSQITTLVFFGDARQRFLFLPFLAIFAGWGLENIIIFCKAKFSQYKPY